MSGGDYEYDVTVSFAGEDRQIAERFAELLKAEGFTVFYDRWNTADLWGTDLFQHLDEIYSKKARFCVVFISAAYVAKAWTNHELKSAQARAFQQNDAYILPVRIDDTVIPGIRPTLGYVDLRHQTIEAVAQLAAQKINAAKGRSTTDAVSVPRTASASGGGGSPTGQTGKLRLKRQFTDQERDNFLDEAFEFIAKYFEDTLTKLASDAPGFVGKFKRVNANHFTATIYRDGKNVSQCGICLGGLGGGFSNQIAYSNDPTSTNSMNEGVSVATDDEAMFLKPVGLSRMMSPQQKSSLSHHEAAEMFWELLIAPLQR